MMIPKKGTLERLMLEKLWDSKDGVTFLDFVGTGITQDNIDQIVKNLQTGIFESEMDSEIGYDA